MIILSIHYIDTKNSIPMRNSFSTFFTILAMLLQVDDRLYSAYAAPDLKDSLTVKINDLNDSKKYIRKDLIEYINEGRTAILRVPSMYETRAQKNAITVLGMTGTGKSTLVNYLNEIPLICYKNEEEKWVLDLKYSNVVLPGGFAIGHSIKSKTHMPAVYSPKSKDFSFIDNPGFDDTREMSIEIANGFFREFVTQQVTYLKFLLLVNYDDVAKRGLEFRRTMQVFYEFLGVFDEKDERAHTRLSESIGIIVTRVRGYNQIKEWQSRKNKFVHNLLAIIDDESISDKFSTPSIESVFRQVLENGQLEIFSNPENDKQDIDNLESTRIHALIGKLNYTNKSEVKIRTRIKKEYAFKLNEYLNVNYQKMDNLLQTRFITSIRELYEVKPKRTPMETFAIYRRIKDLLSLSTNTNELDVLLKQSTLSQADRDEIVKKKQILAYFIQILPPAAHANTTTVPTPKFEVVFFLTIK